MLDNYTAIKRGQSKGGTFEKFNVIFTIFIIVWAFTPYFQRNLNSWIVIISFIGWWLSAILMRVGNVEISFNKKDIIIPVTTLWIMIISLYILKQLPNFSFGNYYYIILYYMPVYFFSHYMKYENILNYKRILGFCFIVFLINAIGNIFILLENPYATKELTGGYGVVDLSLTNTLTDVFIFAYVLVGYLAFILVNIVTKDKLKWFFSIYAIVLFVLIVKSTFFIAILTLVLMVSVYLLSKGKKHLKIIIKYVLFIVMLLLFFGLKNNVLYELKKIIPNVSNNYVIVQRLNSIINVLIDFSFSGSLAARIKDIGISINTFVDYPLFGKGYLLSSDISNTGIGMHSHLFDDLARFGIVGFSFELGVYITFFRNVNKRLSNPLKNYYNISWIGFIFYAMFNPIVYPASGLMIFFIFPLAFVYLDRQLKF